MHGLTVRWSLVGAPEGAEQALASYVEHTSHARFSVLPGLRFKTWRMRSGEWFEGCYVFDSGQARDDFQRDFVAMDARSAGSPGTQMVGSRPVLVEACSVVAVAEGASGFVPAASYA